MSFSIKFSDLEEDELEDIAERCSVLTKITQYSPEQSSMLCFTINKKEDKVYVPLGMWEDFFDEMPLRANHPKIKVASLREPLTILSDPKKYRDQDVIFSLAMRRLEKKGSVFLSLSTGFGKTFLGCYMACHLKRKVVVICHLIMIKKQWVEEFQKYTTAKVQLVKTALDPDADVYVIGPRKISLMNRSDFLSIGTVIVDEAHMTIHTTFTKSLFKFTPRYLIGLSATPRREDGLHSLFPLFFGSRKEFLCRLEVKDFTVIKVETPFVPIVTYNFFRGKSTLAWDVLQGSLEKDKERQKIAVELACKHSAAHRILILCYYTEQTMSIFKMLDKRGQDVEWLCGDKKEWRQGCRILVAGTKKAGVGFNDPTLTMLILMSDTKNVAQFEGRIRTNNNIIYDLVDDNKTLERHWESREAWYKKRGAKIKVLNLRDDDTSSDA